MTTDRVDPDALLDFAAGSTAFTTLALASLVALMSGDQARIDDAREVVIFALRKFVDETNAAIASKTERIESEMAKARAWAEKYGPRKGIGLDELTAQSDLNALRTMVEKMRGSVTIAETLAGRELQEPGPRADDHPPGESQAVAERYGFKWSQRGTLSVMRRQFAEWQARLDREDLAEMLAEYRERRDAKEGGHGE